MRIILDCAAVRRIDPFWDEIAFFFLLASFESDWIIFRNWKISLRVIRDLGKSRIAQYDDTNAIS